MAVKVTYCFAAVTLVRMLSLIEVFRFALREPLDDFLFIYLSASELIPKNRRE